MAKLLSPSISIILCREGSQPDRERISWNCGAGVKRCQRKQYTEVLHNPGRVQYPGRIIGNQCRLH